MFDFLEYLKIGLDKKETKNQACTETILNFGAKSLRIHLVASLKLASK